MLPAERLWGPAATALAEQLSAAEGVDRLVGSAEAFLRARLPPDDPQVELVGRIVAAMLHDPSISRVDQVTERFGLTARTLQRLVPALRRGQPEVGAAALPAARGRRRAGPRAGPPWAEVATDLGYFDQSHFIRDFTAAIGLTPVAYAQACRTQQAPVSA